jgi:2-polyprenyl-3-methyl-5-hydroxy-6-metoxy-1,4-benzoquinol methylase
MECILACRAAVARSAFFCARCRKGYSTRDVYLDLTLLATAKEYQEIQKPRTELFRSPLVSFVYERGWRQNFSIYGFPGPDEEVKMAQDFLKPTVGGVLLDVSCGSGLFTRRFAQSGDFKAVIALDFSENMLRQTYEFIKQDRSLTAVYSPNCFSPLFC